MNTTKIIVYIHTLPLILHIDMQNSWVRMDIINLSRTLPLALHIDMQSSWVRMDTTGRHIDDIGAAKLRRRRFAAKKTQDISAHPPLLALLPCHIYIAPGGMYVGRQWWCGGVVEAVCGGVWRCVWASPSPPIAAGVIATVAAGSMSQALASRCILWGNG